MVVRGDRPRNCLRQRVKLVGERVATLMRTLWTSGPLVLVADLVAVLHRKFGVYFGGVGSGLIVVEVDLKLGT